MARQTDIEYYQEWRLTSPMAILFIAIRRFSRVVRSVIEIVLLGGLAVVLLRFLDVGLVTAIVSYAAAVLVFVIVSAALTYFVLRVNISNDGVAMKSGVFQRTHKVIPWDKIRSVNLESGPIERMFKLVRVSIDTASSMGSEIEIPAMPVHIGTFLKSQAYDSDRTAFEEINEDSVPPRDAPEHSEHPPLFSLKGESMFIAALCARGLLLATVLGIGFVAAITSNAYILYYQLISDDVSTPPDTTLQDEIQDTLTEEIETNINFFKVWPQVWRESVRMREMSKQTSTIALLLPFIVMFTSTVVILIPSLIIGLFIKAVIFFVSHKNYRLCKEESKLVCDRGMITRKTTTVDIPKIQSLNFSLSLRSMLFRRYDVRVQQSYENATIQTAAGNTTHQVEVPCVQSQFCRDFAGKIFPKSLQNVPLDPRSKEIQRFSPAYFFVNLFVFGSLFVIASWGFFWFVSGVRGANVGVLFLIPFGVVVWWQYWRRTGYAFYESYILLRKGFLGYELRVIPISKLQEVKISQSLIQKIRNRCSLQLFAHSTAYANALKVPFIDRAFAERVRDYLLYQIESSNVRWR